MECFVCRTCAVQYKPSESPPDGCTVCEDERQYVGWHGQRWTTVSALKAEGLHFEVRTHERDLTGICATPKLGIGQRSLLVQTEAGNVLWDCQGFIDDETVEQVRAFGGIAAISASHPHFYGCMVEWSRAFGGVPIHLPRADARWVMRPDPAIRFWEGRLDLLPGITLVQCGGHFEGSSVLHWSQGAEGRGVLLVGDTIQVVSDRRFVSFIRSYPNLIPLPAALVRQVVEAVTPLDFDRIYGGWWDLDVTAGAKQAVTVSAERYLARMGGEMAAGYG